MAAPSNLGTGASNVTIDELELSIIPVATNENASVITPNSSGLYTITLDTYPFGTVFAVNMPKGIEVFDDYTITVAVANENGNQELTFIKDSTGSYGIGVDGVIITPMTETTENTLQFYIPQISIGEFKMQAKHKLKDFTMEIKIDIQWDESIDLAECTQIILNGSPEISSDQNSMIFQILPYNVLGETIRDRGNDISVMYSNSEHLSIPLEYDPAMQLIRLSFIPDREADLQGTLTVTMDKVTEEIATIARKK